MPVIKIHISPLTHRILHTRYGGQGEEPYKVESQDPYHFHLCFQPLNKDPNKISEEYKLLEKSIDLDVSVSLYKHLSTDFNYLRIGMYLHKFHKQRINEFIETAELYGDSRMNALKKFCDLNDITEDDLALGSGYKSWQRYQDWKEKNKAKTVRKYVKNVSKNGTRYKRLNGRRPVPAQIIIRLVNNYFPCGLCNLLYRPIQIKRYGQRFKYCFDAREANKFRYERAMLCYLLSRYGCLSSRNILKFFKLKDVRVVNRYISEIKFEKDIYDHVKADLAYFDKNLK